MRDATQQKTFTKWIIRALTELMPFQWQEPCS
jgi:hypothetical protein